MRRARLRFDFFAAHGVHLPPPRAAVYFIRAISPASLALTLCFEEIAANADEVYIVFNNNARNHTPRAAIGCTGVLVSAHVVARRLLARGKEGAALRYRLLVDYGGHRRAIWSRQCDWRQGEATTRRTANKARCTRESRPETHAEAWVV